VGTVPEDHYRQRFDEFYGVERFWFKRATTEDKGIPYVVEIALAETAEPGDLFYAVKLLAHLRRSPRPAAPRRRRPPLHGC
jgi:hypothetical protein